LDRQAQHALHSRYSLAAWVAAKTSGKLSAGRQDSSLPPTASERPGDFESRLSGLFSTENSVGDYCRAAKKQGLIFVGATRLGHRCMEQLNSACQALMKRPACRWCLHYQHGRTARTAIRNGRLSASVIRWLLKAHAGGSL